MLPRSRRNAAWQVLYFSFEDPAHRPGLVNQSWELGAEGPAVTVLPLHRGPGLPPQGAPASLRAPGCTDPGRASSATHVAPRGPSL